MNIYRNIVYDLLILFLLIGFVTSLSCYHCKDCDDPFNPDKKEIITSNVTGIFCKKTRGAYIIDRNITDMCTPFTAVGNGVWCCQTDLCNNANKMFSIGSFCILLIIGIILK